MNLETARILAQALKTRWAAESALIGLLTTSEPYVAIPLEISRSMVILAETYVHEQRIINLIVSADADE